MFYSLKALALFLVIAQLQIAKVKLQEESACSPDQFQCYNGQCISATLKCNSRWDCLDGSDEIFEQCYDTICESGTEYKCSYGGCYDKTLTCDGKKDCWDGTDEYFLECTNDSSIYETHIIGDCRDKVYTQFQCQKSKECISYTQLCNGYEDCSDKTDESLELCVGTFCPEGSFRCGYGACIAETAACDHSSDCRDGSDELHSICKKKHGIAPGKEWIISKGHIPNWQDLTPSSSKKSCTITLINSVLKAKSLYNGLHLMNGSTVSDKTTIRFTCRHNHVLEGNSFNTCNDGLWQTEMPTCVIICDNSAIRYNPKLNSVCEYKGKVVDCKTIALKMDTLVGSSCAVGYKPNTNVTKTVKQCNINGNWETDGKLECIPDCGKVFDTVETFPWVVSIYQRTTEFNYEYRCLGTIIDPYHVITVVSCFPNDFHPESIIIVLGNHTVGFNTQHEHGFDSFTITEIYVNKIVPLAMLRMVNPLILSARVRPICYNFNNDRDTIHPITLMNHTVNLDHLSVLTNRKRIKYNSYTYNPVSPKLGLGEPLVRLDSADHLYYLAHIVNGNSVVSFQSFKREIRDRLKANEMKLKANNN